MIQELGTTASPVLLLEVGQESQNNLKPPEPTFKQHDLFAQSPGVSNGKTKHKSDKAMASGVETTKKKRKEGGGRKKWEPSDAERYAQRQIVALATRDNLTQVELGELLGGKSFQTAADVLHLKKQTTLNDLVLLSEIFNVPIRVFFEEGTWKPSLSSDMQSLWVRLNDRDKKMVLKVAETFVNAKKSGK